MQYKTIVLELLEQNPPLHERLRSQRRLLSELERYAGELKKLHLTWMELLPSIRPEGDRSQVSSEAMELALENLQGILRNEFSTDGG